MNNTNMKHTIFKDIDSEQSENPAQILDAGRD